MIPFHSRFPELAASETRCLRVRDRGGQLPVGEYGYVENYCAEPDCDCRRVLLCVTRAEAPHTVLATIADYLLDFFQKEMITDPAYVARLARHY